MASKIFLFSASLLLLSLLLVSTDAAQSKAPSSGSGVDSPGESPSSSVAGAPTEAASPDPLVDDDVSPAEAGGPADGTGSPDGEATPAEGGASGAQSAGSATLQVGLGSAVMTIFMTALYLA